VDENAPEAPPVKRAIRWLASQWFTALLIALLLVPLTLLLLLAAAHSLQWRYVTDAPIMLYMGYLMDVHGYVPYRDFFDMNMPGTYLTYAGIGRYFGYDDLPVRHADLMWLALLLATTALMMRIFGLRALWLAAVLFGLRYLKYRGAMSLQREYLALLPVALALLCLTLPKVGPRVRGFFCAFFFAIAATYKPHLLVGYPLTLLYLLHENPPEDRTARAWFGRAVHFIFPGAIGGFIPAIAVLVGLAYYGVLGDFFHNTLGYLPLYGGMTGGHTIIDGWDRVQYNLHKYMDLGHNWFWVYSAAAGCYAVFANPNMDARAKRFASLIGGLAFVYSLYPHLSGQFWTYHWLPMMYFLILGTGLCITPFPSKAPLFNRLIPIALGLFMIDNVADLQDLQRVVPNCVSEQKQTIHPYFNPPLRRPRGGRPDAIANFLDKNLKEGETVQPLDWAGTGVVHGMLIARAPIATRYVYHFHFFHHVSTEFIQDLRADFIEQFQEAKPRFVVEGRMKLPYCKGDDSARAFPAFRKILKRDYEIVKRGRGFRIWERTPDRGTSNGSEDTA